MTHLILFAILVLSPVVILTLLRVNAAIAYLSLCLGFVLVNYVSSDAVNLLTAVYPHASNIGQSTVKIIFLWLPVVLTVIAMFHSVRGSRLVLNVIPALGVGILGLVLTEPLLSPGLVNSIASSSIWRQFQQAQTLIVGIVSLVSLIFLWVQSRSHHGDHKRHSKG